MVPPSDLPAWYLAAECLKGRLATEYLALMDSQTDRKEVASLHEIYHYVEDVDVRARDPDYLASQEKRIDAIIRWLEGNSSAPLA
jgi:hypothetical protein